MKQDAHTDTLAEQLGSETADMVRQLGYGSLEPAFGECIELAHKSIAENFVATAAPHGGEWPPRKSERTGTGLADANNRTEGTHPLLIKSGKLFQAATSDFGEGAIEEVRDRDASIGIDPGEVSYAATHNYGDAERGMPQREFEDVSDAAMDEMAEAIADRGIELLMESI